jgi:hypothetical protein
MTESLTTYTRRNGRQSDTERAASRRLDLVKQLAEEFSERNSIMEAIDRVVYMSNAVRIPAAWDKFALEVKAPLALRAVNTITAALSVNAPVCHFEPVRLGSAGEQNATLREHFFDSSWQRQEDEAERQLFRIWMHHLVTHGSAVFKTLECTKTAWNEYYRDSRALAASLDEQGLSESDRRMRYDQGTEELKRKAAYPILTTVVPPSNFYYLQTERGFSVACEVSDVPYYEALTATGSSLNRGGRVVPRPRACPRGVATRHGGHPTLRKSRCGRGPAIRVPLGSGRVDGHCAAGEERASRLRQPTHPHAPRSVLSREWGHDLEQRPPLRGPVGHLWLFVPVPLAGHAPDGHGPGRAAVGVPLSRQRQAARVPGAGPNGSVGARRA